MDAEQKVLSAARKLLVGKEFCGKFSDRRHIDELMGYRDAIYVARSELIFREDLSNIQQALSRCRSIKWPAIREEERETVIFTSVGNGIPLGDRTWQITHVDIIQSEFIVAVKSLRPVSKQPTSFFNDFNVRDFATATGGSLRELLTLENVQSSMKYLFILVLTLADVFVQLVKLFVIFTNVILTHFPRIVDSLTPLFIAIVNGLTKCVGGFYLLVSMIWRSLMAPQPPTQPSRLFLQNTDNARVEQRVIGYTYTDSASSHYNEDYREEMVYRGNVKQRSQFFNQ